MGQNHQTKKYQQHFKLHVFDSPLPKRVPFVHEQTCALANPVVYEVLGPLHMAFIGPFNDPLQMIFVTVCFVKVIVYFLTMVESPFFMIIWGDLLIQTQRLQCLVYVPAWKPWTWTLNVGKYTILTWILWVFHLKKIWARQQDISLPSNQDPTEPSPTGKDSASNWNGNGELRPKIWTEPLEKQKGPERDMQKWRCFGDNSCFPWLVNSFLIGTWARFDPVLPGRKRSMLGLPLRETISH